MSGSSNPGRFVDRRKFLAGSLAGGAALMLPFRLDAGPIDDKMRRPFVPNALLRIDKTGEVSLSLPKTEMGQSVYTAIAMLAAEELEIDPDTIKVILPPGDAALFGQLTQTTGGSNSMQTTWEPVRQAAANARAALVAAAAAQWKKPISECSARDGKVVHSGGKKAASYGMLVIRAAQMPIPVGTPLKKPEQFRFLGKPTRRLDSSAKVSGTAEYGIDVVLPNMKIGAIAQSPEIGGKLKTVDDAAAMAVKGVRQIIRLDDAVAVVADNYWSARKGLDALAPTWAEGPNAGLGQADIQASYAKAGDGSGVIAEAATPAATPAEATASPRRVAAVYEQPFLAHAPMEPGNCVIHCQSDKLEIWTGTQIPSTARELAAKAIGLPVEKVRLNTRLLGGGFGRRLEPDYILRAIEVARQVNSPLKLIWSREEDMQHGLYRPFYHDRIEAEVDAAGKPIAWRHKVVGASIIARLYPAMYKGVDVDAVEGSVNTPYMIPAKQVEFVRHECAVPTSWWRGVGGARSAFVVESFIDELAASAKIDPVGYRRELLVDPRAVAVLDLVAQKSDWNTPPPKGRARGVAIINLWETFMAHVVEVENDDEGGAKVVKVTVAVDCGQPINPLGIEAQVEGGVIFGISAAMFGEVTIAGGCVEQSNFHDYRVLRINEAPEITIHIIPSTAPVGGLGEPPVAAVMPAVANAVFALTGKRVRRLPIAKTLASSGKKA